MSEFFDGDWWDSTSPREASTEVTNRMRLAIWAKLAEHSGIAK